VSVRAERSGLAPSTVGLAELESDPYPLMRRLREAGPVAFCPELDALLVLRWADVVAVVSSAPQFRSDQPDSHLTRFVGPNMLHSEGDEHRAARTRVLPAFRATSPRVHARLVERYARLRDEHADGTPCDLVRELCIPLAADATIDLLGCDCVDAEQMTRWSPLISQGAFDFHACHGASSDIAQARQEIGEVGAQYVSGRRRARPDTVLGCVADSIDSIDEVRRLIEFMIIGADTGPREGLSTIVACALGADAGVRAQLGASAALRRDVIDEALRWESPIGAVTRQARVDVTLDGFTIPRGARVLGALGSANRDPARWPRADDFVPDRGDRAHLSFGGGMHGCIGAAVTRRIADAVLAMLAADPDLRLLERPSFRGWWYRGPAQVPVAWA
jgi:cytochrome P450